MIITCRFCGGPRPLCSETKRCRGCGMEEAECVTTPKPKGKRPCPVCTSKRVAWMRGDARLQCLQCRTIYEPLFGSVLHALDGR